MSELSRINCFADTVWHFPISSMSPPSFSVTQRPLFYLHLQIEIEMNRLPHCISYICQEGRWNKDGWRKVKSRENRKKERKKPRNHIKYHHENFIQYRISVAFKIEAIIDKNWKRFPFWKLLLRSKFESFAKFDDERCGGREHYQSFRLPPAIIIS